MRDLLAELTSVLELETSGVFCSVVETRGSTPQKAGAAMLVFPDGSQRGTLGGGCVEAEVKQKALRTLAEGGGAAELLTFCLDDNYGWDDGLICGGRMVILADPLQPTDRNPKSYFQRFRNIVEAGTGCIEAVVIQETLGVPIGSRYLFHASGTLEAMLAPGVPPDSVIQNLPNLAKRPGPSTREGVAYLPILPRVTLLIVGAGHVGQAVARLAAEVDFEVWVVDDRALYASAERFPQARRRLVGTLSDTLKQLVPEIGPAVYTLIVTRGHNHDEEALYYLAPTAAGYVGMIGSKRKIKLIFDDLMAKGIAPETLARVHAPLGLDIGSQTVPEIAVSIVAELIAQRNLGRTEVVTRPRLGKSG